MAALDFPSNPTTGQVFEKWTWDGNKWNLTPTSGGGAGSDGFTFVQDTLPEATAGGQTWFNTSTGDTFTWYEDSDSGQWVMDGPGGGGVEVVGNGLLAYTELTGGDTDGIGGTWTRLNGMDAVVDLKAGHTYKISARCRFEMEASASGGLGNLSLSRGTTYDNVAGLAFWRGSVGPTTPGNVRVLTVEAFWTPDTDISEQLFTVWAALDNSPAGIFSHRPRPDVQASFLAVEDVTLSRGPAGGGGPSEAGVWTTATLTNSWLNYGGGYQFAQYRKVGDIVYLRGLIGAGNLSTAAFTLPDGFRPVPGNQVQFATSGTANYVDVTPSGEVVPAGGANTAVGLDGIYFSTVA